MDTFTLVDGIVAIVIVVSGLLAFARGFVREALAILGWIIAALVGFAFAGTVQPLLKQIPFIPEQFTSNCQLSIILAFALTFAVVLVIVSILAPLFATVVQRSFLGGADQAVGFLFGIARGILLVAVAFFLYNTILSAQNISMIEDSRSAKVFGNLIGDFNTDDSEQAVSWLEGQYDKLVNVCVTPE